MTITAKTCRELATALNHRGFFLVTDLPRGTRIEYRRGAIMAKLP
ncbi:hypothetical protein [Pseudomonas sp. RC10]